MLSNGEMISADFTVALLIVLGFVNRK